MQTIITGSGSFVPQTVKKNSGFVQQQFYNDNQQPVAQASADIIAKFEAITGIEERRYANDSMDASGMATIAARLAIEDARINPEIIDQLIVAHNFGDISFDSVQSNAVPSLASRVKHALGINNPGCVAYDLLFGCPGWLQGLIHADAFGKAGVAKTCLVIGAETLSRVIDVYDRDSMIFSDGAGAVVTEFKNDAGASGLLKSVAATYAAEGLNHIYMGKPNFTLNGSNYSYLKMQGRKVYEFALKHVPAAIKECIDSNSLHINQIKKIFIHQANEKMDEAIVHRLFELYGIKQAPAGIMPMNIKMMGNSSVATIPTLFDMVRKGQIAGHSIAPGDIVVFASVGAGMNINAVCYRV